MEKRKNLYFRSLLTDDIIAYSFSSVVQRLNIVLNWGYIILNRDSFCFVPFGVTTYQIIDKTNKIGYAFQAIMCEFQF